jgi:hypothetical protein
VRPSGGAYDGRYAQWLSPCSTQRLSEATRAGRRAGSISRQQK